MKKLMTSFLVVSALVSVNAFAEGNGEVGSGSVITVEGKKAKNLFAALTNEESGSVTTKNIGCYSENASVEKKSVVLDRMRDLAEQEMPFYICDIQEEGSEDINSVLSMNALSLMNALIDAGVTITKTEPNQATVSAAEVSCSRELETQQGDPSLAPEVLYDTATCTITK